MSNTVLILGCGSKLGNGLLKAFEDRGYTVYGISGSAYSEKILPVEWSNCSIDIVEPFLRTLPTIDCVIFNQNSSVTPLDFYILGKQHILDIWRESKSLVQSHYVNCVLPVHILQSLHHRHKITTSTRIGWMLSGVINDIGGGLVDYVGQKVQNYATMKYMSEHNTEIYLGVHPGKLTSENIPSKASGIVDFLIASDRSVNGGVYKFEDTNGLRINVN